MHRLSVAVVLMFGLASLLFFMEWCFLLGFASLGLTTSLSDLKAAGASGVILGMSIAAVNAALALVAVMYFI